jgi:drug/metabolite transporter (DMT)-like permease
MNPWTPLVVATLGWGSAAVLTRSLLTSGLSPLTLVLMRFAIALALLLVVSVFWRRFTGIGRGHWARGAVLGAVALGIPNILFTLGLADLPVSLGGLLIALIPLATVGAAHFLVEGERFNPRSLPGLVVSLVGAGILVGVGGGSMEGVGNLWRGVLFSVIAVGLAGIGTALSRRYALEVGGDGLVLPQFAAATAVCLVVTPFFDTTPVSSIQPSWWVLLIALGTIATGVPFTSFLIGAAINPAARLGIVGYLVPVIAVTLAVLTLGETLTVSIVVGAVLIIGGVVLTERSGHHIPVPGISASP